MIRIRKCQKEEERLVSINKFKRTPTFGLPKDTIHPEMERQRRTRTDAPVRRERRERNKVPEMENLLSQMQDMEVDNKPVGIENPEGEELLNGLLSRKRNGDEKYNRERRTTVRSAGSSRTATSNGRPIIVSEI